MIKYFQLCNKYQQIYCNIVSFSVENRKYKEQLIVGEFCLNNIMLIYSKYKVK
jgi:hypothetical protein